MISQFEVNVENGNLANSLDAFRQYAALSAVAYKKFCRWATLAKKSDLVVRNEDLLTDPVSWLKRAIEHGASAHGVDQKLSAIVATVSRSDEGETCTQAS